MKCKKNDVKVHACWTSSEYICSPGTLTHSVGINHMKSAVVNYDGPLYNNGRTGLLYTRHIK